jgi:hypothetical protein
LLIDERYQEQKNSSQISKWIRDQIQLHSSLPEYINCLQNFLKEMKSMNFKPKATQLTHLQPNCNEESDD